MSTRSLLVIGEALVDEFRDGPIAGGAPFNVARSLATLGAPVRFVSRIHGTDDAGQLVLRSAQRYGLATDDVQRDATHDTGRVTVHESGIGHSFEIHDDAAWDHLALPPVADAAFVYFGTLAQRHAPSRAAIRATVKRSRGIKLLDLNLRPGTDTAELAAESLMLADWVKLNEDELDRLFEWFGGSLGDLMARFALQRVLLTRGAAGYACYGANASLLAQGDGAPQLELVDSVGAGDAFTALWLAGCSLGRELTATLALANRFAAAICGVRGPLPADPAELTPWRAALHALPLAKESP